MRRARLTKNIVFRSTPAAAAAWRLRARAGGQSLGDWIRGHLPDSPPPAGRPSPGSPRSDRSPADPDLLRELAAIGNNLNQIARRVNSARHPDRLRIGADLAAIERGLSRLRERPRRC